MARAVGRPRDHGGHARVHAPRGESPRHRRSAGGGAAEVAPGVTDAPDRNLLEVDGLEVVYYTREHKLKALHEVSFAVRPGEIVGIVGESGCGKSTLSAALLGLLPPNGEITSGSLRFKGRELRGLRGE